MLDYYCWSLREKLDDALIDAREKLIHIDKKQFQINKMQTQMRCKTKEENLTSFALHS